MRLSMLLLFLACTTQAKTDITWLQLDWPPHQIISGPYAGEGTYDLLSKQLISRLPQFNHNIRLTNLQRMEQAFVQGETGICTMVGMLYSPERAQNRVYSDAMIVASKMMMVFTNPSLNQHPAVTGDTASLAELASDQTLKGAYQPDRQYPAAITELLSLPDTNLIAHNFTSEVNAIALLKNARVDYVIDYPERLNYFNQLLQHPLVLHIKNLSGIEKPVTSYIACSKDKAGVAAIDAINAVLPQLWQNDGYLSAMRRWVDDVSWHYLSEDIKQIQQSSETDAR